MSASRRDEESVSAWGSADDASRRLRIVGLDLSLAATGVYTNDGPLVLSVPGVKGVERLHQLSCAIDRACRGADVVVMEGYSFNSKHSHAHALGELGGVVRVVLYQRKIPVAVVVPTTLKKYATGKGNATKDWVLAAAVRMEPSITSNNEADAYWLRIMGLAHYEQRDGVLPEYRQQALAVVDWPQLEEKEENDGGSR